MRHLAWLASLFLVAACGGRMPTDGSGGSVGGGAYGGGLPWTPGSGGNGGGGYGGGKGGAAGGKGGAAGGYGTGGHLTYGTGGWSGTGGWYGTGGWSSGGAPGCANLPTCGKPVSGAAWTVQMIYYDNGAVMSISAGPSGPATIAYQGNVYDDNGQPVLDEWGIPLYKTTTCSAAMTTAQSESLRCVVESAEFQAAIRTGFACTPSYPPGGVGEQTRLIDGGSIYLQQTLYCSNACTQDEVILDEVRRVLYSLWCTGPSTGGSGGQGGELATLP